jgi:hypothetical protein
MGAEDVSGSMSLIDSWCDVCDADSSERRPVTDKASRYAELSSTAPPRYYSKMSMLQILVLRSE